MEPTRLIPTRLTGSALPDGMAGLARTAADEHFAMVQRLITEFDSGSNDFSRPGESLWFVSHAGQIIAVGGINIDPYYNDSTLGRIRHLYVHPQYRRSGIAVRLMAAIEHAGAGFFESFQLFTSNPDAARFYQAIGYSPVTDRFKVSHVKPVAAG